MTQNLSQAPDQPAETMDEGTESPMESAAGLDLYLSAIEGFAEQAALDGHYGLQDVCLLLMEAVNRLQQSKPALANSELPSLLATWLGLVRAYRQTPRSTAEEILRFLRHPALGLSLADDELAVIGELLAEGTATSATILGEADPQAAFFEEDLAEAEAMESGEDSAPAELPRGARELVELLMLETASIGSLLEIAAGDPTSVAEMLMQAGDELVRFARAAQTAGFNGLAQACEHADANVQQFLEDIDTFDAGKLGLLQRWAALVAAYLPVFPDSDAGQELVKHLCDSRWPLPLSLEAASRLLVQLRVSDADVAEDEEIRPQEATAADLSLELPDDLNQELLETLLQELPTHTQQFSEALQRLQTGGSQEDIEIAQRIAHTLKGSANTAGIRGVAVLTHHLEDILLACAKEHTLPAPALIDSLVEAADCLAAMTEALLGLTEYSVEEALPVLQEVLDWANRINLEGLPKADDRALPRREAATLGNSDIAADITSGQGSPEPTPSQTSQTPMVRVPTDQIENLFRLSGESIILNSQAQERLRRMKMLIQTTQAQMSMLQQLGAELEELIDLKDLSGRSLGQAGQNFDSLEMDQYNELHTASRRMVEAAVDAREMSLDIHRELEHMDEVLEYQQRLVIDTQGAVMQTRLVPISSIAPRLQRGLRQTCRLTGKAAELTLSGTNLPIDGDTLNALVEPLMHLLRNAVDHGIESSEERLERGKPLSGRIEMEFDREGNNILVRCRDDGRGLDYAAIRAAAEKRGALQPGQEVSEDDLKRFILLPNFSTRTQSTQTSGRGVGMDVVRSQIISLGGGLSLSSSFGRGLAVELRVPLPLSRSHALLAHAGHYRIAISNKGLTQIYYSGDGELKDLGNEQVLLLGDSLYPAVRLRSLLHVAEHRREARSHGAVLLVQHEDRVTAVLVDSITESRDVVIKNLGHYIPKLPGFIGATILGDGSVTPVLDIPELLQAPAAVADRSGYIAEEDMVEAAPTLPTVLVVDDSLSNRRSLEQLLDDAGFRVRTARDGIEAAESIAQSKPEIVLTDLEMPRMNGIELASHIRAQAGSRTLPVIMITSRTTQKHRQMAEEAGIDFYLTKPVRDDDLLEKMVSLMHRTPMKEPEAHA